MNHQSRVCYWGGLAMMGVWMAACIGCGKGGATVEGRVTFDGQPVEAGTIVFEPADGAGPSAGGAIENGRYRLAGDAGVTPGKKTVRITAMRKTGRQIEEGPPAPPGTMVDEIEQFIPATYNTNSSLQVDVTGGQSTHDFVLTSD
jgi:hypothetical protein